MTDIRTIYYKLPDRETYDALFSDDEITFSVVPFNGGGRVGYPTGVVLTNEDGDEYPEYRVAEAFYAMALYGDDDVEPEGAADHRFPEEADRSQEDQIVWDLRPFFAGHVGGEADTETGA